jgi:hypothetical protein
VAFYRRRFRLAKAAFPVHPAVTRAYIAASTLLSPHARGEMVLRRRAGADLEEESTSHAPAIRAFGTIYLGVRGRYVKRR